MDARGRLRVVGVTLVAVSVAACGEDGASGSGGSGGSGPSGVVSGVSSSGAEGAGLPATGPSTSSTAGAGGGGVVDDPDVDGPFAIAELDGVAASSSGNDVPVHVAYPTAGPDAGPFPVVVVAHGFQLPASQYTSYVRRLATHGFVALTADYPASFVGVNNVENAEDLSAALDWAGAAPELAGVADASVAGMTGHSMGGKLALLAATLDRRVHATLTLDPVDGSMGCSPADCPDVSSLMPLPIPTGFVGETTDAMGGFMSCAPAADNFTTFYAGTTSPSLSVTVHGANHMSFLDDVSTCGFPCSVCNPAQLDNGTVNGLARAFTVAFYRRHLKGQIAYDAYLTGAEAQARYVETGLATIASK